jgi:hypothetical protein
MANNSYVIIVWMLLKNSDSSHVILDLHNMSSQLQGRERGVPAPETQNKCISNTAESEATFPYHVTEERGTIRVPPHRRKKSARGITKRKYRPHSRPLLPFTKRRCTPSSTKQVHRYI